HELLFAVEPIQLLVIHRVPFTRQHPAQPSIPEAPPLRGQVAQSLSDRRIVRPLVLVAQRRTIQPYQPACVPLTQPVALHHPAHRLSLHRRPQTFFPSRSLSAAFPASTPPAASSDAGSHPPATSSGVPPTPRARRTWISTCRKSRSRSRAAGISPVSSLP